MTAFWKNSASLLEATLDMDEEAIVESMPCMILRICTTAAAVVRVLGGKFLEVHRHVNVSESQNPTLGSDTWC